MTIDRAIRMRSYSNRIDVVIPAQQFIVRRVYAIAQSRVLLACLTEITATPRETIFQPCITFFVLFAYESAGGPGAPDKTSTAALHSLCPRDPSPSGLDPAPRSEACKHAQGADKTFGTRPRARRGDEDSTTLREGAATQLRRFCQALLCEEPSCRHWNGRYPIRHCLNGSIARRRYKRYRKQPLQLSRLSPAAADCAARQRRIRTISAIRGR